MSLRLIILVLVCGLLAEADLRAEEPAVKGEELTALGEQMEQMSSAFRRLRRQAAEPAFNESSLELTATMQQAAKVALTLIPVKADELPEAERARFITAYQQRMEKLITALAELGAHFQASDNPAAVKAIAQIADLQKASHREFRKREHD